MTTIHHPGLASCIHHDCYGLGGKCYDTTANGGTAGHGGDVAEGHDNVTEVGSHHRRYPPASFGGRGHEQQDCSHKQVAPRSHWLCCRTLHPRLNSIKLSPATE